MLDRRQRETGDALEAMAQNSTKEWMIEEQRLTSEQTGDDQLAVSVDAGWQKRGSGKAYDNLSGHCTMIGKYTGKITNYKVRSRSCRVCSEMNLLKIMTAEKTGRDQQKPWSKI
ncbi:uncharacterized protein LOC143063719 [Mytilus galloprovincialis]|uniref:uncharacterized protein LOC143063719 n=1 Tax=Mytilus galloprovincialis TaxID=29158 RepID=UPI003F7C1402